MKQTQEQLNNQIETTREFLEPLGWTHTYNMRFLFKGRIYDLGVADLTQIDHIVKEGLFLAD